MLAATIVDRLKSASLACGICKTVLTVAQAKVGDLTNLYLGTRQGPVDSTRPLTASELAAEARCTEHPLSDAGTPLRMFPILDTAALMDRWVVRNARTTAAPRPIRPIREHRPQGAGDFVNRTLSSSKPAGDKPRPPHRHRTHVPRADRPADAPKRFGDEGRPSATSETPRKKKGKKGGDDTQNAGKGRRR